MKREGHLYLLIGLVVSALVFMQFNPFTRNRNKIISEVKEISGISRLLLDVQCNIFFVEGDHPGIIYEGPESLVRSIKMDVNKGIVTIKNSQGGLISILSNWINPQNSKLLNIYVVVKDISSIEIGDLLEKAGSSDISADRMNVYINKNEEVIVGFRTCNQNV
jgi:hypothetical protein